jgi:hypothetical protein
VIEIEERTPVVSPECACGRLLITGEQEQSNECSTGMCLLFVVCKCK